MLLRACSCRSTSGSPPKNAWATPMPGAAADSIRAIAPCPATRHWPRPPSIASSTDRRPAAPSRPSRPQGFPRHWRCARRALPAIEQADRLRPAHAFAQGRRLTPTRLHEKIRDQCFTLLRPGSDALKTMTTRRAPDLRSASTPASRKSSRKPRSKAGRSSRNSMFCACCWPFQFTWRCEGRVACAKA